MQTRCHMIKVDTLVSILQFCSKLKLATSATNTEQLLPVLHPPTSVLRSVIDPLISYNPSRT